MPFSKEDESPLENCIYCWFLEYSELLIQRHNEKKKKTWVVIPSLIKIGIIAKT